MHMILISPTFYKKNVLL